MFWLQDLESSSSIVKLDVECVDDKVAMDMQSHVGLEQRRTCFQLVKKFSKEVEDI